MYGLLGSANIWLRYSYLKIWNLRVQKMILEQILCKKTIICDYIVLKLEKTFGPHFLGHVQNGLKCW